MQVGREDRTLDMKFLLKLLYVLSLRAHSAGRGRHTGLEGGFGPGIVADFWNFADQCTRRSPRVGEATAAVFLNNMPDRRPLCVDELDVAIYVNTPYATRAHRLTASRARDVRHVMPLSVITG